MPEQKPKKAKPKKAEKGKEASEQAPKHMTREELEALRDKLQKKYH